MEQKKKYVYNGPVLEFERCVQERFKAETYAVSAKKAKSNLAYQWKIKNGRTLGSKITLPGKIELAS